MAVWRLMPVEPAYPRWEAISHRGPAVARALDEGFARDIAEAAFGIRSLFSPGKGMRLFDDAVRASTKWSDDLKDSGGIPTASIFNLRDHLPTAEVARLGAALPPVLRASTLMAGIHEHAPPGKRAAKCFLPHS